MCCLLHEVHGACYVKFSGIKNSKERAQEKVTMVRYVISEHILNSLKTQDRRTWGGGRVNLSSQNFAET